jgi:3-hydroxyacyl-CoA dehydrogenase/enoyl-CoA hydratase/3-hydroxybutyryl-CoA epimerase
MNTAKTSSWTLVTDADGIAWLAFDKPGTSTNVLSRETLLELDAHLQELRSKPPRGLVVRSAKSSGFIAGADVREFVQLSSADQAFELVRAAQRILDGLESLPCPASSWPSPVVIASA